MGLIKFNIHNSRECILTIGRGSLTCITDQSIKEGDVILHPLYSKVVGVDVSTIVVKSIDDERPSRGDWKTPRPATFRQCSYERRLVPGSSLKEAGYLRTEVINEGGKQVEKAFLQL